MATAKGNEGALVCAAFRKVYSTHGQPRPLRHTCVLNLGGYRPCRLPKTGEAHLDTQPSLGRHLLSGDSINVRCRTGATYPPTDQQAASHGRAPFWLLL